MSDGKHLEEREARLREELAELHEQRRRLEHVTRLSTMGEMAAGIAHEVNQPLTAISTYAQASRRLIESGRLGSELHLEILEKISRQARRAGDVIRRLRDLAERRESQHELLRVNELVAGAVELADADARFHSLTIELELADGLPPVIADPIQVQQVLLNLLRNAVDAVSQAGRSDPLVVRTARAGDDHVEVAVVDRGEGIDDRVREQLFQPFFTTKPNGTGLGLSISRSIVSSHGGRLWQTPNPDGGTTFHFTVPVAVEV